MKRRILFTTAILGSLAIAFFANHQTAIPIAHAAPESPIIECVYSDLTITATFGAGAYDPNGNGVIIQASITWGDGTGNATATSNYFNGPCSLSQNWAIPPTFAVVFHHVYSTIGVYSVALTLADNLGYSTTVFGSATVPVDPPGAGGGRAPYRA